MKTTAAGRERKAAGHTLIELAVVVAVVGVAAALAYPALAGLRQGQELEKAAVGMAQCLRLSQWRSVVSGRSGSPSIHSQPIRSSCWQKGFSTRSYSHWILLITRPRA